MRGLIGSSSSIIQMSSVNDLKLIKSLNENHSTELAELVDMTFGAKPDDELQRLISAELVEIDATGLHLNCRYHRWESAEKNDRLFNEHTDETTRVFFIPFAYPANDEKAMKSMIRDMIDKAKANYLKGWE